MPPRSSAEEEEREKAEDDDVDRDKNGSDNNAASSSSNPWVKLSPTLIAHMDTVTGSRRRNNNSSSCGKDDNASTPSSLTTPHCDGGGGGLGLGPLPRSPSNSAMPDSPLGLRPVVRKISNTSSKDLLSKFEQSNRVSPPRTTTAKSTKPAKSLLSRSRPGSVKAKSSRDSALEEKVLQWIQSVIDERPSTDYEHFIQDGVVLSRVMTSIVFNSVPIEDIDQTWGANPSQDRVKAVIREIRRYGVVDVFEAEDLIELRNIPKVTKCLAQLSKLAASDKDNLLNCAN